MKFVQVNEVSGSKCLCFRDKVCLVHMVGTCIMMVFLYYRKHRTCMICC